jgi:polar amino acid transport system substrate-binding protein
VGLCNVVLKLVHGMPTVVLLMVLYYVVFGSIDLSGLIVAIVGFSLVFAVAAFGMLDSGVRAVDAGQLEAASALGYTDNAAFFKLILPQAALHFMPDLTGSVISLLKGTSVVGYIAVQDLTKMGDIVRSATYDAFFPLIAVTILYFAIEWVLGRVIALIAARMDPRRRTPDEILKGLTT